MALTVKKKSSYVFAAPSYIKGSSTSESKIEKIINDTIKEKIFNLLDINRAIYIKLIEYFPVYTICNDSGQKSTKSIMMRIKNRKMRFREITIKEIQLSGINTKEFNTFLDNYGAKKLFNCEEKLENL